MAPEHEYLKARFKFVRQDLEQALRHVDDSDLPWSPEEGMPTIAGLLLEIANKEKELLVWLKLGTWPDDGPDAFPADSATLDEIKATLASLRTETYAYVDSLSAAQLSELVPCPEAWWEAMRLTECPRSEIIRNLAAHEWYHTGQLVSYLWIRSGNPNDWK